MTKPFKKTILLDLDGVLNTYDGYFDPNYIPPIKDGAFEFVKELSKDCRIVIFTSGNLLLASKWLLENNLDKYIDNVTNVKEPSFLIIDDRCINFCGEFQTIKEKIDNFKVWFKN
ncbi:hypothetical protein IJS77_02130 [bacterium]|nr:hypothetical protein [bacterium]